MPQVFVAVATWVGNALFLAGASAGFASFIGGLVYYSSIAFVLNRATALLTPKPKGNANRGLEVSVTDSGSEGFAIFGSVRCTGINKIPPITGNTDGRYLEQVLELALHEVDSFQDVYAFDETIRDAEITAVSGASLNDGLVASGKYDDALWMRRYRGTATQIVDYRLTTNYPANFSSDFRGRGRAYAALTYDWGNGKLYTGGVPLMTFFVNGARAYDPRRDSTNGGSGPQLLSDPTTWEWSCTPAIGWAWYAMSAMGGRVASADIDWPSVAAAANVCGAPVAIPGSYSAFAAGGNASIAGKTITKTGGVDATWDASIRSTSAVTQGSISGRVNAVGDVVMIGFNTDPTTDNSYTSIDYAFYFAGLANTVKIFESGTDLGTFRTWFTTDTVLRIDYDGTYMRYYIDGRLVRTVPVPTPSAGYYFDSSMYNTGASATIDVQPRYTFNGRFGLVRDWRENSRLFIDAMLGRVVKRGKKWYLYAGAYDAPVIDIGKGDWLSIDSIKTVAPRDGGRWNTTRCWYTDPKRNWQREECFPRRNATYKSADGAEEISLELQQPACTNEHEAQRKAELVLRQSRNQIALVGRLGPRFRAAATGEMAAVTFEDFGWVDKIMRVRAMDLLPDGSVRVAIVEEQAADWTDLAAAEYNAESTSVVPATNPTTPTEVQNPRLSALNNTLRVIWDDPIVKPVGTRFRVRTAPGTSAVANSGFTVWDGSANVALFQLNATSPVWMWIQAYVSSYFGPYEPNTIGLYVMPYVPPQTPQYVPLLNDPDFINSVVTSAWIKGNSADLSWNFPGNVGGYVRINFKGNADSHLKQTAVQTIPNNARVIVETQFRINSNPGGTAGPKQLLVNLFGGISANSKNFIDSVAFASAGINSLAAWRQFRQEMVYAPSTPTFLLPHIEVDRSSNVGSGNADIDHLQVYWVR